MKCPYCKKEDFIPDVVWMHTDAYGGGVKNFECEYCKKVVQVNTRREVFITNARKTENESDW